MYLADSFRIVRDGLCKTEEFYETYNAVYQRNVFQRILEEYDLYAFESSAMEMAADLRIDTPERLESVLGAILSKKRRVFMEARYDRRRDALRDLRGFPETTLPEGRDNPERVGLALDSNGDGTATLEVTWVFSRAQAKREMGDLLNSMMDTRKTRLEKDADFEIHRLGVSLGLMRIDLNVEKEFTREEFFKKLASSDPYLEPFRNSADHYVMRTGKAMTDKQLAEQAWRDFRLNEIARFDVPDAGKLAAVEISKSAMGPLENVINSARRDLDGELVYAIALAAVLEAESDVIRTDTRKSSKARRDPSKAASRKDLEVDRLNVISMNLSDRKLAKAIRDDQASRQSGEAMGSRVRHYVRGHLFRARNGKIVYRRPHWRGSFLAEQSAKKIVRVS